MPESWDAERVLVDAARRLAVSGFTFSGSRARAFWLHATPPRETLAAQGWKLHVSAHVETAPAVLDAASPVLLRARVSFKCAASLDVLAELNAGELGASQVGKFITVYPRDEEQAVELAVALDEATRGLDGPRVPSDQPLRPGSLVSYRYGEFAAPREPNAFGELVGMLRGPDGELVADRRAMVYTPPGWALDPFERAGVAEHAPAPAETYGRLLGGRYAIVAPLAVTVRGGACLVLDTRTGATAVAKYARAGAPSWGAGRDAPSQLRREASVLASLEPGIAPRLVDHVRDDDIDALIVEAVDGETLEALMRRRARTADPLGDAELRTLGAAVADALDRLHAGGLVHRDVKSSNVLLAADGRVLLLDFELAAPPGELVRAGGTPGWMSPQQGAGEPVSPSDDVFALGSLLWRLATRAQPLPLGERDELRTARLLEPAVAVDVEQLITRCRDPAPARRPASAAAVAAALRAGEGSARTSAPHAPAAALDGAERAALRRDLHGLALYLAGSLRLDASRSALVADPSSPRPLEPAALVSAVASALSLLVECGAGGDEARVALGNAARSLASGQQMPRPGLVAGEAGVVCALLRASSALGSEALRSAALGRADALARMPHAAPDLAYGSAGRIIAHLRVFAACAAKVQLAAAIVAGDAVLTSATADAPTNAPAWVLPASYPTVGGEALLGGLLGSAGIGVALFELGAASGERRFADAARRVGADVATLGLPVLRGDGVNWPPLRGDELEGSSLEHGAAATAPLLVRLAEEDETLRPLATRALHAAARSARFAPPTLRDGLAGTLLVLLDAYSRTGERRWLGEASDHGRLLRGFLAIDDDAVIVRDRRSSGALDLLDGAAGVACALAQLDALCDPGG